MQYNQKNPICCGENERIQQRFDGGGSEEYDRNVVEPEVKECNRNVIVEIEERQKVDENEEKGTVIYLWDNNVKC